MIWFKHPNNLPNDKRLAALIDKEGSRGYGMYLYIIEMLCAQPDGKLCFSQLKVMARKGFPRKYMEKIIREYRLFILCGEEEFESAIDFNSKEKANHLQNDLKTSSKTEHAENGDKRLNNSSCTEKTRLARIRRDKNREEEIKRKDDVVVQKRDGDDDDAFAESCNDVSSESCRNGTPDNNSRNDDSYSNDISYSCDNDTYGSNVSANSRSTLGNGNGASANSSFFNGTSGNNSRNGVSHRCDDFYSCDNDTYGSNVSANSRSTLGSGNGAFANSPFSNETPDNNSRNDVFHRCDDSRRNDDFYSYSNDISDNDDDVSESCCNDTEYCNDASCSDNGASYNPVTGKAETEERLKKCHTSAPGMPPLSVPNATPQHPKCHSPPLSKCGISPHQMWHFPP